MAEPDMNDLTGDTGIYNVRSGSDRVSQSGTPYAEW